MIRYFRWFPLEKLRFRIIEFLNGVPCTPAEAWVHYPHKERLNHWRDYEI